MSIFRYSLKYGVPFGGLKLLNFDMANEEIRSFGQEICDGLEFYNKTLKES